jgi:hypothetical protein
MIILDDVDVDDAAMPPRSDLSSPGPDLYEYKEDHYTTKDLPAIP